MHGFNQADRYRIFRQVPQWTMAAWIEDGIKRRARQTRQCGRGRQRCLRSRVLFEATSRFGLRARLLAPWINRWLPTLRTRQGNFGPGILEDVIRCGEFL